MTLQPGFYLDFPAEDYHADPAPEPSLSSHGAHLMLSRSPKHLWLRHPRLGNSIVVEPPKEHMLIGEIAHAVLLGGSKTFDILDFDAYRSNESKRRRDDAICAGKVPVLRHKYDEAVAVANELRKVIPFDLSEDAVYTESTMIWRPQSGIYCRCRTDLLTRDVMTIVDLKFVENAKRSSMASNMIAQGYHVQAVANLEAVETTFPQTRGRARFFDCFVETDEPFGVIVVEMAGSMLEYGERQWRRAKAIWQDALQTGKWSGYPTEPVRVEAPAWCLSEEMDAAIAAAGPPAF